MRPARNMVSVDRLIKLRRVYSQVKLPMPSGRRLYEVLTLRCFMLRSIIENNIRFDLQDRWR